MNNSTGRKPVALPPDGVEADFENPQDGYYTMNLATTIVCVIFVNFFFLVHAYVKTVVKSSRLLLEDWFCAASWLLVNGYCAINLAMAYYGEGRNMWELTVDNYRILMKFVYVYTTFYAPTAFCTKVTLLLLIARVFSVHPTVAKSIRIFIILIFLAYVPIEVLKICTCNPIPAYWENLQFDENGLVTSDNPKCRDKAAMFMGDVTIMGDLAIAIITDVIILLLPIPMAYRMEASRWQKIKITILLGAGGAATVTTCARAWLNVQFAKSPNFSKNIALVSITSVMELAIGLLCACLPSANLLFEKWMAPKLGLIASRAQGRMEKKSRPNMNTDGTSSSPWSSLKSVLVTTTRTLTYRTDRDIRLSRRKSNSRDLEGGQHVVFNNRLDMPSIGSTTDDGSRSSREIDHRGLDDEELESAVTSNATSETKDEPPLRRDSVMDHSPLVAYS